MTLIETKSCHFYGNHEIDLDMKLTWNSPKKLQGE